MSWNSSGPGGALTFDSESAGTAASYSAARAHPRMNRHDSPAKNEAQAVRERIRRGEITGHTSGLAAGHVQGNVVILPKAQAADFLRFCQSNPKPCPVIGMSEPGDPAIPALGEG